ncbi:Microtubule bundling protein [Asimina triloba]
MRPCSIRVFLCNPCSTRSLSHVKTLLPLSFSSLPPSQLPNLLLRLPWLPWPQLLQKLPLSPLPKHHSPLVFLKPSKLPSSLSQHQRQHQNQRIPLSQSSFKLSSKNPISDFFPSDDSEGHSLFLDEEDDKPREECGVVGIFGDPEASRLCYLALHALQHRGQEGAGIVTVNNGVHHTITGVGLVSDVFTSSKLDQLPGTSAIGHVRYSTAGASMLKNVQPFVAGYQFGSLGVAHNGNLVNYRTLRARLEERGSIFNTSSDTEVVLHLIATFKQGPLSLRIVDACKQLEGAYSMVFLSEDKLVAVRDPFGFRPLVMGRRKNGAVVFASETCALDLIEANYEREVSPGELVVVDKDGVSTLFMLPQRERKACIFELIYFSQPNSFAFGRSIYQDRYAFGQMLATEAPADCDIVIAVPDSGVVAAHGYAYKAGIPIQMGLKRSPYVGRTFIEPSQKIRDFGVNLKLSPVRPVLEGKRVVVVDDSIVRGTTSSKIVRLLKDVTDPHLPPPMSAPPRVIHQSPSCRRRLHGPFFRRVRCDT